MTFERFEKIVGNVFAGILTLVIFCAICISLFRIVFRDGRGIGMYGSRGNSYMYDDY